MREVDVVDGCFMLVRQEAIKQVGMLDEQFHRIKNDADAACQIPLDEMEPMLRNCRGIFNAVRKSPSH